MELNNSITVDVLNQEERERFVPLLVYLLIIMLTGIPGNIIVIVIYRRNAGKSTYQFFITCLAVVDCITCCIVPFVIHETVHPYKFHGNWLCKFNRFLQGWPTLLSGGTLCVIGIDRYRMVCKPHKRQITNKMAKTIFAILGFISAVLSIPFLKLFGVYEIQLHTYYLTGTECAVLKEYHETIYLNLFNGLLWILFMTVLVVMVVLYIFIARQIFHHAKKRNSEIPTTNTFKNKHEVTVGGNESNIQIISYTRKETSNMFETFVERKVSDEQTVDSGSVVTDNDMDNDNQAVLHIKRCKTRGFPKPSRKLSKKEWKAMQTVFIMFLISLFFITAFLPHLILRVIGAVYAEVINKMTDDGRAAYGFFIRSHFINAAVNPFVYCACATKFRKDAKTLIYGAIRQCFRR